MANITSTQDGDWATGATWVGGIAPASTDRVTLAHVVTVSTPQTVDDDGAADAITINAGGELVIASTLTCNGSIQSQASNRRQIDMQAGSRLTMGNGGFTLKTPSQYTGSSPWFRVRGTEVSPVIIETVAAGTNAMFTGSVNYYGLIDAEWCNFTRIGSTTTNYAMAVSAGSDGSDANASLFRLVDCTFTDCGDVHFATDIGAHAKVTIQRVKFINGQGANDLYTRSYSDRTSLGVRLIDSCSFSKTPFFNAPRDLTITNNVFNDRYGTSAPDDDGWASFANNLLIHKGTGTDPNITGQTFEDNYLYMDAPSDTNPHFIEAGNHTSVGSYNIHGNIWEGNFSAADGDCIIISANATSPITITMEENLFLPNGSGECSGTPFSALGNSNVTLNFNKNTAFVGSQGCAVGETYAGHTGMLASFKNNLFWDTSARGYKLYDSGVDDTVSDLVSAANANYNGGHNLLAGSNLKGYNNLEFSAGSPGANDVDADPELLDPTRNLLAFDVSLGGDGVIANALARFAARAAGYTPAALGTWVKAGYAPTSSAYNGTGEGGVDIGAIPYQAPAPAGGSGSTMLLMGVG